MGLLRSSPWIVCSRGIIEPANTNSKEVIAVLVNGCDEVIPPARYPGITIEHEHLYGA
jgi:hypothetical protein